MTRVGRPKWWVLGLMVLTLGDILSAQASGPDFFEKKIRPVLATSCAACHSSQLTAPMGGLVLDTKQGMRQGGSSGPVVVAGAPSRSLLLRALSYKDLRLKMPPTGKLDDAVIADFEQWIAAGAVDPRPETAEESASSRPAGPRIVDQTVIEKGREWWGFQPLREQSAPAVNNRAWGKTKVDSFVLAKLEAKSLPPSPPADARTLIQRVYLDLLGLKPSYEQVEAFANDPSPDRYEKLVDELLASPHYGERWGRYWLDMARYGEDNRNNDLTTPPFPHAWRYRDWVIESLNQDLPYDRFVKLQLAADQMPGTPRQDLRGLGFMGLSPREHKDGRLSAEVFGTIQLNEWEERVDTVSRGLLGLTVGCARCHDHKFDPIPTKDYYSLAGVIASAQQATRPLFEMDAESEERFVWLYQRIYDLTYTANLLDNSPGSKPEESARQVKKYRAELALLNPEMEALGKRYPQIAEYMASVPYPGERRPRRAPAQGQKKEASPEAEDDETRPRKSKQIDPQAPFMNVVFDAGVWLDDSEADVTLIDYRPGQAVDLPLYRGGNFATPGDSVPRGFPQVLNQGPDREFHNGSGRLELAEKIFTDAAPLTARVIVNRVWGWHFDKHLVATPSDFGTQGQKPSHPELLEDLAARFVANGWSLKWLHREIMLSATYRQASHPRAEAREADPTNRLLWRMNPRRLDIEAYRDALLQAAGRLDLTLYGPSVHPEESRRRTVYARIGRVSLNSQPLLAMYDFPEPFEHSPGRTLTTTPLQQLFVLNSGFVKEQAKALAQAVEGESSNTDKVRGLFRKILAREPSAAELDLALSYLAQAKTEEYAQMLLATNEVIFWP